MKAEYLGIAALVAVITIAAMLMMTPTLVMAASTSDANMMPRQPIGQGNNLPSGSTSGNGVLPNEQQPLSSVGSTEAPTNSTVAKTMIITAIPDKPSVSIGSPEVIHVKAAMENGTGLSNVTLRGMIVDYVTSKEKVVLGGKTDKKGELDLTANIGPHAKPGQFLVLINGTSPDGKEKGVSTGFVVTDGKGSSSSGGSSSGGSSTMKKDSKGRCSGSSCR